MSTNLDGAVVEARDLLLKPLEIALAGYKEPTADEVRQIPPTILVFTLGAAMALVTQLNDTLKRSNRERVEKCWVLLSQEDREVILKESVVS